MSTATEQLNGAVNAAKRAEARRLNMREDFILNNWLHGRVYKRGESIEQIVEQAKAELNIEGLNYNHIQFRLDTFKDTLPLPKPEPLSVLERLHRLEKVVSILASNVINGTSTSSELAWLADFISEVGL